MEEGEGGQEPAASKAPRAGVGSEAARAVQGFATASGESCALGFCSGPPPPGRHFKVGAKVGSARDSRDAGFELTQPLYSPPPAGRSLARLCPSHQPAGFSTQTRAGLRRPHPPLRSRPDWRGLSFVFRPAREAAAAALGCSRPRAWESRLGTERAGGAAAATGATVREGRGPELRCSSPRGPRPRGLHAPHRRAGRRKGPRAGLDQRKQKAAESPARAQPESRR